MAMSGDDATDAWGPATRSVRAIRELAARIDWFAPSASGDASWIEEHHARVRAFDATAIPAHVAVTHHVGGWAEFAELAALVRDPKATYDWKFGVLKPLCKAHSMAKAWSAKAHVDAHPATPGRTDELFVVLGEHVLWNAPALPSPDVSTAGAARGDALWYRGFGVTDVIEAIEWQLAEGSDDLETNPFVPLLRGYAAGQYPFALAPHRMALFRFGG